MSDQTIDAIANDRRNLYLMIPNIQRIQEERAKLPKEDQNAFESFVFGWISGLIPQGELDRAIGEGLAFVGRINDR